MTPYSDIRKKLIGATICCLSYNAGASDLRRMFAQRLLLLCRTCYANLQMMVGLALENNPKSGKSHK